LSRICPSTRTVSIRSFSRLTDRSSVDFPQPDGPMSAVTRPRRPEDAAIVDLEKKLVREFFSVVEAA
jgi:hypothetical protein